MAGYNNYVGISSTWMEPFFGLTSNGKQPKTTYNFICLNCLSN